MSKNNRDHARRAVLLGGCAVTAVALLVLGWHWFRSVPLDRVEIRGHQHAQEEELLRLAALDSSLMLFQVVSDSVSERVRRHPWIREASVSRWPTGTVMIRVEERRPVLLTIDGSGRPAHYLDAEGYVMPLVSDGVYDVPIMTRSSGRTIRAGRVEGPLQQFVGALARVPREVVALVSEVEIQDDEIWIVSVPAFSDPIRVRLGREDFEDRMHRWHAFWHQAVLSQPDKRFALVDLRFNSQIVTREYARNR